jgi:hypothetical protein
MKIEIDSSRPDDLRKLKREHEFALQMIDAALLAISKSADDSVESHLPQLAPTLSQELMASTDNNVATLISAMPSEFNMRVVKLAAEAVDIPDSRLRREIAKLIESGALVMTQKGQGRRPATFRKA